MISFVFPPSYPANAKDVNIGPSLLKGGDLVLKNAGARLQFKSLTFWIYTASEMRVAEITISWVSWLQRAGLG
jgi:hypothetical protein